MSSDAKQIGTNAYLDGEEWAINGEMFYISGAGDPRCKAMIATVLTNPDADIYKRQSQIVVPVAGPDGHMRIRFNDARVSKDNVLWGEGHRAASTGSGSHVAGGATSSGAS